MVWDVMVAAAFVVVSMAVLVGFVLKFIQDCLKKRTTLFPQAPAFPVTELAYSERHVPKVSRESHGASLALRLYGKSARMPKLHMFSELFTSARGPLPNQRDLRLDFFRGLALFCIFIDHIPSNIFAWFTLQAVMCSDAAEIFVFISGFTAGTVYSRTMLREGFLLAGIRVYHRVWQLYVANIVLFVTLIAILSYTADLLKTSRYIDYFMGTPIFFQEPGLALVKVLSLQFQPGFIDILPLYIVCLGFLPIVLAGFRFRPGAVILASLSLWVAVQFDSRIAPPAWPDAAAWGFNPFAWQALFYLGTWLGWRSNHAEVFCLDRRWRIYLAAGFVVAGFLIRFNWTLQGFYGPITTPIPGEPLWQFMSKTNLGLILFVNVFAVALLVGYMIHPQARFFGSRIARPFVLCGRHSLHIFCLSAVLAVFGHLVLNEVFGRWPMQLAVSATGIAIMVGSAALLEWFAAARNASGGRTSGSQGQIGMDLARSATLIEGQTATAFSVRTGISSQFLARPVNNQEDLGR
jgi:hypothetical protein